MENMLGLLSTLNHIVSMPMILARYGITNMEPLGCRNFRGRRCPIANCTGSTSFNVTQHSFRCFSCQRQGKVLDFVAVMENCSVRDAAIRVARWFSVGLAGDGPAASHKPMQSQQKLVVHANEPLTTPLSGVDPSHFYLAERNIQTKTAETFGIGFFSGKGPMNGRIVIPIHNDRGELVAYAGRSIDGAEPTYKFSPHFQRSREVFNLHRAKQASRESVFVTTGFFGTLRLHEAGFENVVSIMSSRMSDAQVRLIAEQFRYVTLVFPNNVPGIKSTLDALVSLVHYCYVTTVGLPSEKELDALAPADVHRLITGASQTCESTSRANLIRVK